MADMRDYGYAGDIAAIPEGYTLARVTETQRGLYKTVCAHGEVTASLLGAFLHGNEEKDGFPAVGDFVLIKYNNNGNSGIAKVLPRKSKFSRPDFSGHAAEYVKTVLEQVVAANFDYVFIMSSLNRDFKVNRITRYLTAARQSGGIPVVILTKSDLCEDFTSQMEAVKEIAGDTSVIAVSSHTGAGLDMLKCYLSKGKTSVFLGMSGVGKSSLINAVAGCEIMAVNDIREDDARGRHTTTHRQLVMLPSGAMVIDTPGMRELGLINAADGINATFPLIEELIAKCRFSNCSHTSEPGCAVNDALKNGSVTQKQWKNYLSQKREEAFIESKAGRQKRGKR